MVYDGHYTWMTVKQVIDKASLIGSGLINLSLLNSDLETKKYCGFYSHNSLNYVLCDLACIFYGFVAVPIYDTLGENAT